MAVLGVVDGGLGGLGGGCCGGTWCEARRGRVGGGFRWGGREGGSSRGWAGGR